MVYTIKTRYCGPTNSRGSQIIATCNGHRLSTPYEYSITSEANHLRAASMLCAKLSLPLPTSSAWAGSGRWDHVSADPCPTCSRIVTVLSGASWNTDTLAIIADILRAANYTISEVS